jgi:hypothetical protein
MFCLPAGSFDFFQRITTMLVSGVVAQKTNIVFAYHTYILHVTTSFFFLVEQPFYNHPLQRLRKSSTHVLTSSKLLQPCPLWIFANTLLMLKPSSPLSLGHATNDTLSSRHYCNTPVANGLDSVLHHLINRRKKDFI